MESFKKSIFIPDVRGDIYSRENLFFFELKENEVWDMANSSHFSLMQLSFLLFRSFLYEEKFGQKLTVTNLSHSLKKVISRSGLSTAFTSLAYEHFIPYTMEKSNLKPRFKNTFFTKRGDITHSFQATGREKNKIQFAGGALGILPGEEKHFFEKFYQKMKHTKGLFYCKTNEISMLKLNEGESSKNHIFTRKILTPGPNFIFYYIEADNSV